MRPTPYTGITGFSTREEVQSTLIHIPQQEDRRIMVGVLASDKTLAGLQSRRYPKRYPAKDALKHIFFNRPDCLNLVHFNTHAPERLYSDMCSLQQLAGPHCHGFQLNMVWPSATELQRYKKEAPFERKTVVLQCGSQALREAGNSPRRVVNRLASYQNLIDYALIDPSGGTGAEFDPVSAGAYFREMHVTVPRLGFGIAGGLSAETLASRLAPLEGYSQRFSIDAEGRLRNPKTDELDIGECRAYLLEARAFFSRRNAA